MDPKHYSKLLRGTFALDLGTSKFCLAAIQAQSTGQDGLVQTVAVPAAGMRRGMLANLEQARLALHALIEQAEKQFSCDITHVVVGIAGSHLLGRSTEVTRAIPHDTVSADDIANLSQAAEQSHAQPERELLHLVPTGYRVDQRELVTDPIGFSGKEITAHYFLIDADKQYMRDVVDLCNSCGLTVVRLYSEPFASASVTVPDSYKELGVAVADIGGGTTDGIVFRSGRPIGAFTINVAGHQMTNDLAIGLNIEFRDAEDIKMRFGIKPRPDDSCTVRSLRGIDITVTGSSMLPILVPRVHELGMLLAKNLLPYRGTLGAGLLLTGGGSGVHGMCEYFAERMAIPVQRAKPVLPVQVGVTADSVKNSPHASRLATVIGLLNLELCRSLDLEKNRKLSWKTRYLSQFINWIRELS